jgi:neutral ceramidase
MKKILKWILRILVGLLLFCTVLLPFLFEKIDRTPYKETNYYKEMLAQLDTFHLDTAIQKGSYFKAGWAKKNITPAYMPDLAGYGLRDKANCLHDSVFTRAFVFDNGKNKAVYVSVDLLIFPPVVEERLRAQAVNLGYVPDNFYLSATHTHNAPGGWAEGPAGRVLAGAYQEEYVTRLVSDIITAIKTAETNMEEAETGITEINAPDYVRNRINMPDSKIDAWIRIMKIRKKSGKEAALIVYSAHANCLKASYGCLSADYPGEMIPLIEQAGKVEFAMYSAGMVGSHIPKPIVKNNADLQNAVYIHAYGDSLAKIINKGMDSIKFQPGNALCTGVLDLPLRAPHLKISEDWRVRPWVFDLLFGPYDPKIRILKINDALFIGMPCDFSGELMKDFDSLCQDKKIKLIITSFNGGYIGYINVDKYYNTPKAEMRDMNWFGPYNQAYFTEIVQRILKKI